MESFSVAVRAVIDTNSSAPPIINSGIDVTKYTVVFL